MHTFSLNFQWAEFLARVYEYTVAIVFKAFFVTRNLRKMLYEEGSVIVILYYKREINKFITLIVVGFFLWMCRCPFRKNSTWANNWRPIPVHQPME